MQRNACHHKCHLSHKKRNPYLKEHYAEIEIKFTLKFKNQILIIVTKC